MGTITEKMVPMSKFMVPITVTSRGSKKMEKITDTALRKITGTPGETKTVAIGGGLQLWVTVNQAGKTLKSWVLRYYDGNGKRQKGEAVERDRVRQAVREAEARFQSLERPKRQNEQGEHREHGRSSQHL